MTLAIRKKKKEEEEKWHHVTQLQLRLKFFSQGPLARRVYVDLHQNPIISSLSRTHVTSYYIRRQACAVVLGKLEDTGNLKSVPC